MGKLYQNIKGKSSKVLATSALWLVIFIHGYVFYSNWNKKTPAASRCLVQIWNMIHYTNILFVAFRSVRVCVTSFFFVYLLRLFVYLFFFMYRCFPILPKNKITEADERWIGGVHLVAWRLLVSLWIFVFGHLISLFYYAFLLFSSVILYEYFCWQPVYFFDDLFFFSIPFIFSIFRFYARNQNRDRQTMSGEEEMPAAWRSITSRKRSGASFLRRLGGRRFPSLIRPTTRPPSTRIWWERTKSYLSLATLTLVLSYFFSTNHSCCYIWCSYHYSAVVDCFREKYYW